MPRRTVSTAWGTDVVREAPRPRPEPLLLDPGKGGREVRAGVD
jgi:hypothetical protein